MLVKFVEDPKYHSPVVGNQDPRDLGIPLDQRAIRTKDVVQGEDGYGLQLTKDFSG